MKTYQNSRVNDAAYWQARYQNDDAPWDMASVSPPLAAYFDQLEHKDARILIAGAGNAYEAKYLHDSGFSQVFVLDFAAKALENFAKLCPTFPKQHLLQYDFFTLDELFIERFDLIIEQTFLCAIDPSRRQEYAQQMHRLLAPRGKLVGVLFDADFAHSPPFSGHLDEYHALFSPLFEIAIMQPCYNSIRPRAGSELFVKLIKKASFA